MAGLGRRCAGWHVPYGSKAAEMIEAYHVNMSQQRAAAVYPPAVTGAAKCLPVIDGVIPELPLDTEVIGRDAREKARPVPFVQQEQLRVAPDVARVGGNVERQVAD